MTWLPYSPDSNSILVAMVNFESEVYEGTQQFRSNDALWNKFASISSAMPFFKSKDLLHVMITDCLCSMVITSNGSCVDE